MKRIPLFFSFLLVMGTVFAQDHNQTNDSSFKALYKAVALHPGYRNSRGIVNDSVVKRWDKDIMIYIEGGTSKSRREIISKLENTIAAVSPAVNNKLKISFTDKKYSANYLINLTTVGGSNWYIKWDGLFNIYNCIVTVNTKLIFNYDQQAGLVSHYFLQSLGDFVFNRKDRPVFTKNDPSVASNMTLWRQDINDIDLRILKVHYADDIKPGMAEKDIDQYFDAHGH